MGERLKHPGYIADHSPPSSGNVKNAWSYTSTPPYVFMAWSLVKHMDFTYVLQLDLIVTQLVKKFPAFYGIQSPPLDPTSAT